MCAEYRKTRAVAAIFDRNSRYTVIEMLVPDWLYSRIPQIWLLIGSLFLFLGLAAGPGFKYFYAYLLLGAISLVRALYIYQCRRRFHRRKRVAFLNETQVIHRNPK